MAVERFEEQDSQFDYYEIVSSSNRAASKYCDSYLLGMNAIVVCIDPQSDDLIRELKELDSKLLSVPGSTPVIVVERTISQEPAQDSNREKLSAFYDEHKVQRKFTLSGLDASVEAVQEDLKTVCKEATRPPATRAQKTQAVHQAQQLPRSFRQQYLALWQESQSLKQNMTALLDDYARGDNGWCLFFSGHFNRNRHATREVNTIALNLKSGSMGIEQAFEALSAIPVKEGGALHSRLIFLKGKLLEADELHYDSAVKSFYTHQVHRYLPVRP